MVAAKSDFAVVKAFEEFNGELKAFQVVSQKIFGFMLGALNRYWEPEPEPEAESDAEALAEKEGTPPEPSSNGSAPSVMEDL